ncbi:NACHT, LRR and PYD domains-containing protein 6-like [Hyperolius riggenbachi]|uniref:NACHT, LRR and PYD domains-containing protein 6-like n=1 Tax=Hyperolius riggenbachi TaxID=752182 RepID=UPI0035A34D3A
MGQLTSRYPGANTEEEVHQELSQYDLHDLKLIYEYFKNDLTYVVETMSTRRILENLESQNILNKEIYLTMKKDLGAFYFSEKLVEDILILGKEAILAFWETLYDLQIDYLRPNLFTLKDEINKLGDNLIPTILLDRNGHPLTAGLKEIQEQHRQYLLSNTMEESERLESTEEKQHSYSSHRHMDLLATSVQSFRGRSQHELIEAAIKHSDYLQTGRNTLECVSPDRLFRWAERLKFMPHAVIVSGVSGIGKTTLLKKFICDWSNGKFYQRFAFLFFFRFKDLNRLQNISLESVILQEYPYLEKQLESILQDPEKLLFIFDGLDESIHEIDFKSSQLCKNVTETGSVGNIVVSLVRQSLLKGCSVLLTSQPHRLRVMDISVFKRIMEVTGFLHKDKQLFFKRFFRNKVLSDKVFDHVKQNGVLYNFCCIPSYCWFICTALSTCFKSDSTGYHQTMSSLPRTLTQLLVTFIVNNLCKHGLNKDDNRNLLTSIGWMAEHGIKNHITRFEKQTLSLYNIDNTSKLFSSFLEESKSSLTVSFSFLQPIIQEFFAALVHYIDYSAEKLQRSLEQVTPYKDNCGEMFLSFLCGLSNVSTRSILKPYVGDLSSIAAKDVVAWLQQTFSKTQIWKTDEEHLFRCKGFRRDASQKRMLLNLYFKLFEMNNKDFVLQCLGSGRSLDFYLTHLMPLDCTVLPFILESCRETKALSLNQCNIQSDAIERLAPSLHTVQTLSITSNHIGDDGIGFLCSALVHPECRIHTLCLCMTDITDLTCSYLGSAMKSNQSLRELILDYNKLEGPHFRELAMALSSPTCKLVTLGLQSTRLTDDSCVHLALGIRNNQSLKMLDISFNDLIGPHFGNLMEALASPTCTIENLRLQGILLSDEHLPSLMPLSKKKNLISLELSHNCVTSAGVGCLTDFILQFSSLQHISLFEYRMLSYEDKRALEQLSKQRPGLNVSIA